MSIKETFKNNIKSNTFTKFENSDSAVNVIETNNIFEDTVLKSAGVTLEQYLKVQDGINKLQDTVAEYMEPIIKEQFKDNQELTNIQTIYNIYNDPNHEITNSMVVSKNDTSFKIKSDIIRDQCFVGVSKDVIKLYEEINN